MALQGSLTDMPLEDLLQILAVQGKGGVLAVSQQQYYAEVYFNRSILHAAAIYRLSDRRACYTGEAALYELLRWTDGDFSFSIAAESQMPQNVFVTVNYIVMEHSLNCDLHRAHDKLTEMAVLRPRIPPDPPLQAQINLELEQWRLLTQINGQATIAQITQNMRASMEKIAEMITQLEKMGLVEMPHPAADSYVRLDPFGGRQMSVLPQGQSGYEMGYDMPFVVRRAPQAALPPPSVPAMPIPQPKPKVQRGLLSGIMARLRGL